jgi:membrane protein required for colicin V production
VGIILAYGLIRGLFRGLVKEASSIIGVLGGFFAAYSFYGLLAGYLSGVVSNPSYRNLLAFVSIFCAVVVLVNVLAIIIKYLLKIVFLGWLDRLGGVVFGFIKDSLTAPYVSLVSEKLASVVASEVKREFATKLDELKKAWKLLN